MRISTDLTGCCLRPWCKDDLEFLVQHANNRKIWRNLTDQFPHPYTEADAIHWISFASLPGNEGKNFAIEFENSPVGGTGVIQGNGISAMTGHLGYWLAEAFWGRGIATFAAQAMTDYCFNELGLKRVDVAVFEWNPASMHVLEKLGFQKEGVLKKSIFKDGQLIDSVMYAITKA